MNTAEHKTFISGYSRDQLPTLADYQILEENSPSKGLMYLDG